MKKMVLAGIALILISLPTLALQAGGKKPSPKPAASAPGTKATPRPPANSNSSASRPNLSGAALVSRVFDIPTMLFLIIMGVVSFIIGTIVGAKVVNDAPGWAVLRGLEATILAVVGGLLARFFISLLLWLAGDSTAALIAVGWGFFIVPGAVDTIAWLANGKAATTPEFLVWLGTVIGAFTGMMNGIWRIHSWKGLGWIAFPLDVTWGLAGSTIGALLHLINFAWANHATETGYEAHRYNSGMRLKSTFALTQGPVMSNLPDAPGRPLYYHERTHVWQNRVFGPLFSLTYLGWMAIWLVPSIIGAIAARDAKVFECWCYYNNPWETWAYLVGAGPRATRHRLIFSDLVILILSLIFFPAVIGLFIWIATEVW